MANYTNHKNNKRLSDEILAEIDRRFKNGEKKVQIARALGISHSVVRKYTTPDPNYFNDAETSEKARGLLSGGMTRSAVSKELGVSRSWVAKIASTPGKIIRAIPEEIKREATIRVLAGETAKSVALALGISASSATKIAKKRSMMPDEEKIEKIKIKIENGSSMQEIATEFNIPPHLIWQISGTKPGFFLRYSVEEKLEMAKLYSLGILMEEITAKFGATHSTVRESYKAALRAGLVEPRIKLSMEDDRELLRIQRLYPQYEEWRAYAIQWYRIFEGPFNIAVSVIHRFFDYLSENSLFERPSDFFLRKNSKFIPNFFDTAVPKSDHGAAMNNSLVDFFDWILIQPEFCDYSDEDEPFILPSFRNPLDKVVRSDHKALPSAESNKKVMPYWMISDLRSRVAQGPNFRDWIWAQTVAGTRPIADSKESRDWFAVSEDQIDINDPNCVYRIRQRVMAPPVLEMWSPVRWVACLIKLQTTGRMGQIRMLDSGEADTFIFNNGEFVRNKGCLAQGTVRTPRRQGALRQSTEKTLCLYFNTNKTGDIGKVGAEKGMDCPWPVMPEYQHNPYYWIEALRNWQSKYNPVTDLVAWKDIPSSRRFAGKSESDCSTYLDTVFLFRTPESKDKKVFPVSASTVDRAWQQIISEYETLLCKEGKRNPDGSIIKLVVDGRSEVSLHGLRVSLITHLILDGDMPPQLMMKVVGHARFIMTIYYTKPGLQRIENALADAAQKLDATKDETLVRDLSSRSAEQLRNHAVFNAKEINDVLVLNPADRNPMGWLPMHDGICLAGGNTGPVNGDARFPGCHNGGPLIHGTLNVYGPAPGGVRNCCRCRWKCAGKHHILGLQATLNNRQFHLYKASDVAINAERKRNELLKQKARVENTQQPFSRMSEMRAAERQYELAMYKMQELALDVAALHRTIERIMALPTNSDGPTTLASQADLLTLHMMLEETDSELLVLAGVCADVEFFPDLDAGTAIFEYAALIDKAFEREGKPLVLARLSEQEKLIASNAIMRELERLSDPTNPFLARRKVVEIMDRGESLEMTLGISLTTLTAQALHDTTQRESLKFLPYPGGQNGDRNHGAPN